MDRIDKSHLLLQACGKMFTTNLIGTDFDQISVHEVKGMNFPQQSNGEGLHISFAISYHAIGKIRPEAQEALYELLETGRSD